MTQRHKHYEAIIAFAEGKEIQYRTLPGHGDWKTVMTNSTGVGPAFFEQYEYRVKPQTLRIWTAAFKRVGIGEGQHAVTNLYACSTFSAAEASSWSQQKYFVKWIDIGKEVEV